MAVEGLDSLARLDAHCLEHMRPEYKRILILNVSMAAAAIARIEHAKEPTIKTWLRIARAEVAMALEREDDLTPGLCGYWVARHSGDCGTWYYGIGQGWVSGGDMVNRVANSQHANYVGHSGCSTNTPSCPGVSYAWTSY